MIVNIKILFSNAADGNQETNEDDEDECSNITEIRFVPEDKTVLNQLFQEINRCQALHPDEEQLSNSEGEDGGDDDQDNGYIEDEDGVDEGIGNGNDDGYHIVADLEGEENRYTTNDHVVLTERGRQILDRIQINYQPSKCTLCVTLTKS